MAEEDSKLYHQDKYKELEDFKYYCKSESNFDYKQPFLLVDTSYLIFYRFFALRMWYSKAHKEKFAENTTQDEYDWLADTIFMEKFVKTFFVGLSVIIKKRKIPMNNLVFSLDCPNWEIWRHSLVKDYKGTRTDSHKKAKFFCYKIFSYAEEKIIIPFVNQSKSHIIRYPKAEGDDINAVLVKYIININSDANINIIGTDRDYIQLCNKNIYLIDIKGRNISDDTLDDEICQIKYLIAKILVGDVSDNIESCYINSSFLIKHNIISIKPKKEYIKCNKKLVDSLIRTSDTYNIIINLFKYNRNNSGNRNLDENSNKIENNLNTIFENNQFLVNQNLIDFHFIPNNIKDGILKSFELS